LLILETGDKKYKILMALLLVCSLSAASAVALSSAKYGPGITHDSAAYMYAAQSFLNGEGFQYFGYPSPFIQWPPLYPILLALGELAGLTVRQVSTLVNGVAFALTVFFAGKWMLSRFKNSGLAIGGALVLFLSVPLLQVSQYLWTEILFVLFFLLAYIQFEKFLRGGKYGSLVLSAVFSALACIDRYAGVTIVAAVCLFLLFSGKAAGFGGNKTKALQSRVLAGVANAAVYGAISAAPMSVWVIRNYIVSGTLLGVRLPSTYPLMLNIKRTLQSVYTWVQPDKLLTQYMGVSLLRLMKLFALLVPVLIAAALLIFLLLRLRAFLPGRKFFRRSGQRPDPRKTAPMEGGAEQQYDGLFPLFPVAFFAVFSALYAVYLVASATSVAFEPINSRYLIPIYLPVVLAMLVALDFMLSRLKAHTAAIKSPFHILIYVLMALYLVYPAANTAAAVTDGWRNGAGGYAGAAWRAKDGFLKFMQTDGKGQTGESTTYYSNSADAVYAMSGIRTYSPPKKSGPAMYGLEQFKASVEEAGRSILIWFDGSVPETLYDLEELSGLYPVKEIGRFQYGKVYEIIK
jgi:hypothetical protein